MRARYIGNPKRAGEGPEVTTTFGLTFLKGAWVSLDGADAVAIRKLKNNLHFEVDAGKAASGQPSTSPAKSDAGAPVAIPDDWRTLHHSTRLKLARSLGATPANAAEADAFLEAQTAPKTPIPPEPAKPAEPSIADPPSKDDDGWGDLDPE